MSKRSRTAQFISGRAASRRASLRSVASLFLPFVALFLLCHGVTADQTQPPDATAPTYRRIYVPADNVDAWPREDNKYLPVDAAEFQSLVRAANQNAMGRAGPAAIVDAEYWGRLEGDEITGRGKWVIERRSEQPAFLPLSPLSPVIRNAQWADDSTSAARLGVWGRNSSAAAQFGLEVPRSGTLVFQWHTRLRGPAQKMETSWNLPAATVTRVMLDLPEDKQPALDGSIVLGSQPIEQESTETTSEAPAYRRWTIAMNPSAAASLRIIDVQSAPTNGIPILTFRDAFVYEVSGRGVDIVVDLHLDESVFDSPEITIELPDDVRLLSAVAEGQELPWQAASETGADALHVQVELPKLNVRRSLTVTLRAWQPLVTDRSWQLPKIRPQGAFWTNGTLELSIAPMFELQRLTASGCVQTSVDLESQTTAGLEMFWFAAHSPDAGLEVTIQHRTPEINLSLGSTLALTEHDLSGRLATRLDVRQGSVHTLSGELAAGWVAESVETLPAEALGEWFVDRHEGRQHIEIQLAEAAAPDRRVTVIVNGRRQLPAGAEPIRRDALRMIAWKGANVALHLLAFEPIEPYVAELIGEMTPVDQDTMLQQDQTLLEMTAVQNPVFDITNAANDIGLRVAFERAQYDADILLEAERRDQQLEQQCHIVVRPHAGRVDRLLLLATQPLGDDVRWTEKTSGAPVAAERIPATDPRAANLAEGAEMWRLRMPHPIAQPVELVGTSSAAWAPPVRLPLLALPEAVEQRGRLLLRGEADRLPRNESEGLQPIPLPPDDELASAGHVLAQPPVRLAYRYVPADCHATIGRPAITLQESVLPNIPTIRADRVELESFFMADGRAFHRATYYLQNHGAERIRLGLPEGARLQSATLDRRAQKLPDSQSAETAWIRLPSEQGSVMLTAHFETPHQALRAGRQLRAPLVEQDFPVLSGEWTFWLPADYTAAGSGLIGLDDEFPWRQRMFGPLGRAPGSRPFNPLDPAEWAAAVRAWPRWANAVIESEQDGVLIPGTNNDPSESMSQTTLATNGAADNRSEEVFQEHDRRAAQTLAGWRAYRTNFIGRAPTSFTVAHPPVLYAWAFAAFFLCLVIGSRMWQRKSRLAVMLAAAAAICSLWLPPVFATLATGAFLGVTISLLAHWTSWGVLDEPVTKTWATQAPATALSALALMGILGSVSFAQEAAEPAATEPSLPPQEPSDVANGSHPALPHPIHRVLIPLGEDGHPSGTKYYVSEKFLAELTRRADQRPLALGQWMLLDVLVRGQVRSDLDFDGLASTPWTVVLEIEVLARDTTIVLPLTRDDAEWGETAALDGIPTKVEWLTDRRGCAIEVAEPGRYQLTLLCNPQVRDSNARNSIALSVPHVPGAKLHLEYPPNMAGLKVMDAPVTPVQSHSPGVLSHEFDRSRLTVEWPRFEPPNSNTQGLRVTELNWLRVSNADIVMETKFIVEGDSRALDTLTIQYDEPWRLLRTEGALREERSLPESPGPEIVRIVLPQRDEDRHEILLRWRLANAGPFGRVRLPPIVLASLPLAQRWLAISSDADSKCELINGHGATAGSANEFLTLWGDPTSPNDSPAVFTNWPPNEAWHLAVTPVPAEWNADQTLHIAAGSDGLRVQYDAQITPGPEQEFQFSLKVSADLVVDQVALTQGARRIPLRWSRDVPDSVNVFFSQRVADPYRITVTGRVPVDRSNRYRLPQVSAAGAPPGRVQFYRQAGSRLEVEGMIGYRPLEAGAAGSPPPQWNARQMGGYLLDDGAFQSARLIVEPNRLSIAGQTLTALAQDRAGWHASFTCHLNVVTGMLDALRLRVPASWVGPYDVQSDVPATLEKSTTVAQQSLLVVRFAQPVMPGQLVRFQIRGPLATEAALPLAVPSIVVENDSGWRHFVAVPTSTGSHAMAWTDVGVQPAQIPAELAPDEDVPTSRRTFEIVSRPLQVVLRPTVVAQPAATVRLADTTTLAGISGGRLIVTRFLVTSHGLTRCTLQLPHGQQLISVEADGTSLAVHPLPKGRWRLPLGAAHLPQFIDIVARATVADHPLRGQIELARPSLLVNGDQIPVEMSLWSFAHAGESVAPKVTGAAMVPALDQAALRLERLVSISEAATTIAVESPRPDGQHWYRRWSEFLSALRDESLKTAAQPGGGKASPQIVSPSRDQLEDASTRLDAWIERCDAILASGDLKSPPAADGARGHGIRLPIAELTDMEWIHCVAEGGDARLVVELRPTAATPRQVQVIGLLAIVGVALAAVSLMRLPAAADVVRRWPHAVLFLAGVAYWAWLWPSWLGLLIAAASTLFAVRPAMPGRAIPAEGSTVVRDPGSHL